MNLSSQNTPPPEPARGAALEISDSSCEGVRFLTIYSPSLRGRGDVSVFAPAECDMLESVPVVLLLHGVYSSHWAWFFKGKAHRAAGSLIAARQIRPMLLVSPSDGLFEQGSGYLNHSGRDYESWIVNDVLGRLPDAFPCVNRNSPVFVTGLSMGGYGALRLGAKYPSLFRGISAHSAVVSIDDLDTFLCKPFPKEELPHEETDLLRWFVAHRSVLPPTRLDCGTGDPLLEANRRFHRELQLQHIDHLYAEFSGAHDWEYWSAHIADSLLFFEQILLATGRPDLRS